jgi:hypothetical protein
MARLIPQVSSTHVQLTPSASFCALNTSFSGCSDLGTVRRHAPEPRVLFLLAPLVLSAFAVFVIFAIFSTPRSDMATNAANQSATPSNRSLEGEHA